MPPLPNIQMTTLADYYTDMCFMLLGATIVREHAQKMKIKPPHPTPSGLYFASKLCHIFLCFETLRSLQINKKKIIGLSLNLPPPLEKRPPVLMVLSNLTRTNRP